MKCVVRYLMSGASESSDFIKFIDESCREPEQRKILEVRTNRDAILMLYVFISLGKFAGPRSRQVLFSMIISFIK